MIDYQRPEFDALGKLCISAEIPIVPHNAGLLISTGRRGHIKRIFPHFVLIFVQEGTLYIQEEGQNFEVREGEVLLLWPHRLHGGTRDYAPGLKFYWLHFDVRSNVAGTWAMEAIQQAKVIRPDVVVELFRRFIKDQDTGRLQPLSGALLVWSLLAEIADQRPLSTNSSPMILATRAYNHIISHFREELSAVGVAHTLDCNAQYLSRVFRQVYRQSIPDTIRIARISQAKELLRHTNHSVRDVSRLTGFNDVSYFQRIFKEDEGVTPLNYRKQYRQEKPILP